MTPPTTRTAPGRLTLRPYQQEALAAIRAGWERGVRRQLLVLPTGSGKCCSGDTLVATDRGLIPIAALGAMPDVRVLSHDGVLREPSAWLDNGVRDTVIITTEHGLRLEGTPNHPVLTVSPKDGSLRWARLDQLRPGDILAVQPSGDAPFPADPVVIPPQPGLPDPLVIDEDWARLLGFITADGCISVPGRVTIAKPDMDALRECERILSERGFAPRIAHRPPRCPEFRVFSQRLTTLLAAIGLPPTLSTRKTIPWAILRSPRHVQAAYLSALFAGDGHARAGHACIEYGTSSPELARQLQICLLGFGILSTLRFRPRTESWRLLVMGDDARLFMREIGIWLERKSAAAATWPERANANKTIPHVTGLIREVNASRRRLGYPSFRGTAGRVVTWRSWADDDRDPPASSLREAVATWEREGVPIPEILRERLRYHYSAVTSVERGRARVYDLTVPSSHSFVGNGIVCHNTLIAARIPETVGEGRLIYVAHRLELLDQTLGVFQAERPDRPAGMERGDDHPDPRALTVVASVQSLSRPSRLTRYRPEDWPLMVCDEAHRSPSPSYLAVFRHFRHLPADGLATRPDGLLLGITGTAKRTDQIGLGYVFQEVAYTRTLRDMIEDGYLVPLRGYLLRGGANLENVRTRVEDGERDFDPQALARAVNTPERNQLVVDGTRHIALREDRPTLVFAASIDHGEALAALFRRAGVRAENIHGEMPPDRRRAILDAFRKGDLQVLVNCQLLLEGIDIPQVSAVVMARPTQSALLYSQALGRATRLFPGKTDAIVLDFVDNTHKHATSLVSLPTLFGLPPHFDLKGAAAHAVIRQFEDVAMSLDSGLDQEVVERIRSPQDIPRVFYEVDLLKIAGVPPRISRLTEFAWQRMPDGTFALAIPRPRPAEPAPEAAITLAPPPGADPDAGSAIEIAENALGHYEIRRRRPLGGAEKIAEHQELETALREADRLVRERYADRLVLLSKRARWRQEPATDKQIQFLQHLGQPVPRRPDGSVALTKGQAQLLIDRALALRALRSRHQPEPPPEPATDKQIRFLKRLGVAIPPRLTKKDARRLIATAKSGRSSPSQPSGRARP